MAKINNVEIIRRATAAAKSGASETKIRAFLNAKAQGAAIKIGVELQKEFNAHSVTKELENGPEAITRVEGFPKGPVGGGYGNIASFFGLSESKINRDIEVMKALFTNYKVTIIRKSPGQFRITISFPALESFYKATPPPSDAYPKSWLECLENGLLQNFSHFLFRLRGFKSDSRSGTGLQVEPVLRKGAQSVPSVPYIKRIYLNVLGQSGRAAAILRESIKSGFKI